MSHIPVGDPSPKRILVVYGTRPEAIKIAPVITAINAHQHLEAIPVVTGQHREMLDQVNVVFGITPKMDLNIFAHGQGLNQMAARILEGLDPLLASERPDAVVVQGDTTTVMAAAIASFYRSVPIVHVEAGLRSHNIHSPFPEEANRKLVSQLATLHLAPTPTSRRNLELEAVDPNSIVVTGNTVIDALLHSVKSPPMWTVDAVREAAESGQRILLVTTHRRENWGGGIDRVANALRTIAERFPDDLVVLPAHRNPIVRDGILPKLKGFRNVITTEPLAYGEFTHLLAASHIVLTDSGGVQEEAPSLGRPVLVMRDNTERPEAVDAGTVKLVGTAEDKIVSEVVQLKESTEYYQSMSDAINPYGDGHAGERSAAAIAHLLGVGERLPEFA